MAAEDPPRQNRNRAKGDRANLRTRPSSTATQRHVCIPPHRSCRMTTLSCRLDFDVSGTSSFHVSCQGHSTWHRQDGWMDVWAGAVAAPSLLYQFDTCNQLQSTAYRHLIISSPGAAAYQGCDVGVIYLHAHLQFQQPFAPSRWRISFPQLGRNGQASLTTLYI